MASAGDRHTVGLAFFSHAPFLYPPAFGEHREEACRSSLIDPSEAQRRLGRSEKSPRSATDSACSG